MSERRTAGSSERVPTAEARAPALTREFLSWSGRLPSGVWAAPGRLNLIGEHTDYNEGFVLPLGIDRYALVAARPRADGKLRLRSLQLGEQSVELASVKPGALDGWAAYVAGSLWAARDAGAPVTGVDLLLDSDVPLGAGLSSSAAVLCATLLAAADLFGLRGDRIELAGLARKAEVEIAGVPVGMMDQIASLSAEAGQALLIDCRTFELERVPLALESAGLALLVVDTKAPHRLVEGQYAARRRACERAAQTLGVRALRDVSAAALEASAAALDVESHRRARHVVRENERVLAAVRALRSGDFPELGRLISASHASLRDDFEVSVPELDLAAERAEQAGALGARLVGGGFGGSVLALVERAKADDVTAAVQSAFAAAGFSAPACFVASSGHGARRVD